MDSDSAAAFKLRQKYTHFRILVIGRANAGKTTILKRVCNTIDDPEIFDEGKNLLEPASARGIHDINRAFGFESNPQFIFHDSPGFEAGDESQLREVQSFIAKRSEARNVGDQLHAIWFCFEPDSSRPLLEMDKKFFNEQRAGNVPVVALFTKFDDLVQDVFVYGKEELENRQTAADILESRFEKPLRRSAYPPKAYCRLEEMHEDNGTHQDQVKMLIEETANALDDLSLKILFVSVQQNNLELCIQYAIK